MKRLMGCKGSHEWIENDGFEICHSQQLESWNKNGNCQEWYNTISRDKVGRIALQNARRRILELLRKNMCWAPCLFLEYSLADLNFKRKLKEQMKNEKNPWRTTMLSLRENSGNKRMIKRKRSWQHKVKPCND